MHKRNNTKVKRKGKKSPAKSHNHVMSCENKTNHLNIVHDICILFISDDVKEQRDSALA